MPISRTKVWGATEVPTVAELNREFNNIVNFLNAYGLLNPLTTDLDFDDNYILNAKVKSWMRIHNAQEYASIQAAIDSLTSESDTQYQGGVVYLPPGVYTLSSSLTMADNIWLVGAGELTRIKKAASFQDDTDDTMIRLNGIDQCGIVGMRIEDLGTGNDNGGNGIAAIRLSGASSNVMMSHLYIDDWGDTSDGIVSQNDAVYIGQDSSGGESGQSRYVTLKDSYIDTVPRNGISVVYGESIWIHDNVFRACENSPVDVEPNAGQTCNKISICDNKCYTSGTVGIVCGIGTDVTGASAMADCTIRGNVLDTCAGPGVTIQGGNRFLVDGNQIAGVTGIGIRIKHQRSSIIRNNFIDGCTSVGIHMVDHVQGSWTSVVVRDILIEGNYIDDTTDHGIQVESDTGSGATMRDIRIINNILHDCGGDNAGKRGISIADDTYDGLFELKGNVITLESDSTQAYAIELRGDYSTLRIYDNYSKGHATKGLIFVSTPTFTHFSMDGNDFTEGVANI
jgi:hypothetical protein